MFDNGTTALDAIAFHGRDPTIRAIPVRYGVLASKSPIWLLIGMDIIA